MIGKLTIKVTVTEAWYVQPCFKLAGFLIRLGSRGFKTEVA